MKSEIVIPNNQYGIEKAMLDTEAQTLELVLKKKDNDPTGKIFAMGLVFQKKMAMAIGKYKMDSFTVKLPEINHIVMKGCIDNVVDMLKTAEVVDEAIAIELECLVGKMTYSSHDSEKNSSEIVEKYMPSPPVSSFFATEQEERGGSVKEGADPRSQKKEEREYRVISFFKSLSFEGKENIRDFLKLLGELSPLEQEEVLQKLSAEGETPKMIMLSSKQ